MRLVIIVICTSSYYKGVRLVFVGLGVKALIVVTLVITLIVLFKYSIIFYFIILAKLA